MTAAQPVLTAAQVRALERGPRFRQRPEEAIQHAVVEHLKARARPGVWYCAIPNGELRSKRTAARLVRQGVVAGAPDLLIIADGKACGLELKAAKGRLSPAQKHVMEAWRKAGGFFSVAHGLDEAIDALQAWKAIA